MKCNSVVILFLRDLDFFRFFLKFCTCASAKVANLPRPAVLHDVNRGHYQLLNEAEYDVKNYPRIMQVKAKKEYRYSSFSSLSSSSSSSSSSSFVQWCLAYCCFCWVVRLFRLRITCEIARHFLQLCLPKQLNFCSFFCRYQYSWRQLYWYR